MKQLQYTVAKEIFDLFPNFKRGVLVCSDICNRGDHILDFSVLPGKLNITISNIAESEPVSLWRKAFRLMGVDPTKDRVSFEGLTRKLLNNNTIKHINPIVDLGNFFSVLYQCPVGIHPITSDTAIIDLKKAVGNETFIALGRTDIEIVDQNEIILTDGANILTRRFCWRQSTSSLVTEESTNLFVNFDFMDDLPNQMIQAVMTDFEAALKKISPNIKSHSFILALNAERKECFF